MVSTCLNKYTTRVIISLNLISNDVITRLRSSKQILLLHSFLFFFFDICFQFSNGYIFFFAVGYYRRLTRIQLMLNDVAFPPLFAFGEARSEALQFERPSTFEHLQDSIPAEFAVQVTQSNVLIEPRTFSIK